MWKVDTTVCRHGPPRPATVQTPAYLPGFLEHFEIAEIAISCGWMGEEDPVLPSFTSILEFECYSYVVPLEFVGNTTFLAARLLSSVPRSQTRFPHRMSGQTVSLKFGGSFVTFWDGCCLTNFMAGVQQAPSLLENHLAVAGQPKAG